MNDCVLEIIEAAAGDLHGASGLIAGCGRGVAKGTRTSITDEQHRQRGDGESVGNRGRHHGASCDTGQNSAAR
jgi:hypothetical protein